MHNFKYLLLASTSFLMALASVELLCRVFGLFLPPMAFGTDDLPRAVAPYSRTWQAHFAEENRRWADQGVVLHDLSYKTSFDLSSGVGGVLVVGDSFTVGMGVRPEEGYVDLLQRALAPMPVVNLGANGAGLDNMNYQLRSFADALKPKLVISAVYADDLRRHEPDWLLLKNRPVAVVDGDRIAYPNAEEAIPNRFPYYHSRLYQIYNYVVRNRLAQWTSNYLTSGESYRLNAALLREMKTTCDRLGARLLVMYIPSRKRMEHGAVFLELTRPRSLEQICSELHIPLLDLTPDLEPRPADFYLREDVHFNPEGHRLAFNRLTQSVEQQHLLAR